MKHYQADVERTLKVSVFFDEDEIEEGDSPEAAASELASTFPLDTWEEDEDVAVYELPERKEP